MTQPFKISGSQIFWLFASFEVGMTVLLTVTPAVAEARQDAWISFAVAGVCALLIGIIGARLSRLYPNQTLIQYSQSILGKWLGKIIAIPYFVQWYSVTGIILRQSSDFIHSAMFQRTPLLILVSLMTLLVVYTVYTGAVEGIARCSEVMGPVIFLTILVTVLLNMNNAHWKQLLPTYSDSGWLPILRGALSPLSFLGEAALVTMLLAFVTKTEKGSSRVLWGVGLASVTATICTVMIIATFGAGIASQMWYPYFDLVRFISVAEFIQNVDALVIVVWIMSVFIKLSIYLFVTSYGTAQWLGIRQWKHVLWFATPAVVILAVIYPNVDVSSVLYPKYWTLLVLPINMVGIPLLLWGIGVLRKRQSS